MKICAGSWVLWVRQEPAGLFKDSWLWSVHSVTACLATLSVWGSLVHKIIVNGGRKVIVSKFRVIREKTCQKFELDLWSHPLLLLGYSQHPTCRAWNIFFSLLKNCMKVTALKRNVHSEIKIYDEIWRKNSWELYPQTYRKSDRTVRKLAAFWSTKMLVTSKHDKIRLKNPPSPFRELS